MATQGSKIGFKKETRVERLLKKRSPAEIKPVQGRLQEAIQHGYPPVGWEGDIHLVVEFDLKEDCWKIFDTVTDPVILVMRKNFEGIRELELIPELCARLKAAELQRGQSAVTIADRLNARNDAITREREAASASERLEIVREWGAFVRRHI